SEGDVLLHAIGDAVCGAAGLPDIGRMFPDTDPTWKDADSWDLLHGIGERARQAGWEVANIDAVLVAQRPKISPFVSDMCERVAAALVTSVSRSNLRDKTDENLGPIGPGEGMEAHAVCLLQAVNFSTSKELTQ